MTVPMHERCLLRSDLDLVDADEFVFEDEMVVSFIGDFDFGSRLRTEHDGREEQEARQQLPFSWGGIVAEALGFRLWPLELSAFSFRLRPQPETTLGV